MDIDSGLDSPNGNGGGRRLLVLVELNGRWPLDVAQGREEPVHLGDSCQEVLGTLAAVEESVWLILVEKQFAAAADLLHHLAEGMSRLDRYQLVPGSQEDNRRRHPLADVVER